MKIFSPQYRELAALWLILVMTVSASGAAPVPQQSEAVSAISEAEIVAAQQFGQSLSIAEWLGPMAPVALSPFFGVACLSGLERRSVRRRPRGGVNPMRLAGSRTASCERRSLCDEPSQRQAKRPGRFRRSRSKTTSGSTHTEPSVLHRQTCCKAQRQHPAWELESARSGLHRRSGRH